MNHNLEKLISLQRLDSATLAAEKRLSEDPERQKTFDARLDAAKAAVADAKEKLTESQNVRRAVEKEVAVHQGRLSKFNDQAMAVKTNQEYHAVQHEIAFAKNEIKALEDKILENMMESDELTAIVKKAEAALSVEQKAVDGERKALASELDGFKASLEKLKAERADVAKSISPSVLSTFELVSKKRAGIGLAEAKSGVCTVCHVRLRPQIFNNVLKNEEIFQCDHCNRILYFVPAAAPADQAPAVS